MMMMMMMGRTLCEENVLREYPLLAVISGWQTAAAAEAMAAAAAAEAATVEAEAEAMAAVAAVAAVMTSHDWLFSVRFFPEPFRELKSQDHTVWGVGLTQQID